MSSKNVSKGSGNGYVIFMAVILTHFISLLGSAMTRFGMGVWAYQTTGQVMGFAGVLIAGFLPGILLSIFVGVWVDRKGPRTLILWGDIFGGSTLLIIFIVLLTGNLSMIFVLLLSVVLSIVSTMQTPALQSLAPLIVPENQLSRANGALSVVTSASDVLGPVLAGALMGFGSLTYVLGINLLTYIIAITILCLLWTRLYVNTSEESVRDEKQLSFLLEVKEGLTFLFEKKALFTLVLMFTVLNFALGLNQVIGQPYILSLGTTEQYGLLSSIFGTGMVLGGLIMSLIKVKNHLVRIVLLGNAGIGVFILLTGLANQLWLIGVLWLCLGMLLPVVNTTTTTLIQINTAPHLLGRVFSMARMLSWISLPVAYVFGAIVADILIQSGFSTFSFLGEGKSAIYALVLVFTGLMIVITVISFTQIKLLGYLERREKNEIREVV